MNGYPAANGVRFRGAAAPHTSLRRRARRWRLVLAVAGAGSSAVLCWPAAAATNGTVTFEIVSVDRHPHPLNASWSVRASATGTDIVTYGLAGAARSRRVTDTLATATPSTQGSLGRLPVGLRPCSIPAEPLCGQLGHWRDLTVRISVADSPATRWYLTVRNAELVSAPTASAGWRVRRIPPLQLTSWRPADRGQTLLDVPYTAASAEHFRSAATNGADSGSLTTAFLPCNDTDGSGSAAFTGGPRSIELSCATTPSATAATLHATHWSLAGDVVGIGSAPARLLTVTLPP